MGAFCASLGRWTASVKNIKFLRGNYQPIVHRKKHSDLSFLLFITKFSSVQK